MRCSASFMFENAVVDSCSMCIRKKIQFKEPVERIPKRNVQSTLNDVYTISELPKMG